MRTSQRIRAATLWISLATGVSACANGPDSAAQQPLTAPRADVSNVSSLQPLVCPTSTTQHSQIGFLGFFGGTLSFGANQLSVPVGAILRLTAFQITLPAGSNVETDVSAVGLTSFLFQQPVSITIDYSRCAPDAIPDGATLQVVYIDSQTKQILAAMGGLNDPVARTITFRTSHLSGYEVAY